MSFSKQQFIQDHEYAIPYHYLYTWNSLLAFPEKLHTAPIYLNYVRFILDKVGTLEEDMSFLDAGCGDGRLIYELKNSGCKASLSGIDYSETAVKFARIYNPGCDIQVDDLTANRNASEFTYDVVVSIETLEHIKPELLPKAVEYLQALLKPGGRLVVSVPHLNRPLDSKHYQHFTTETLNAVLADHFESIEMFGFNRKSPKSLGLSGLAALYYYLYPLKKIGLSALTNSISRLGFNYFEKHLMHCSPNKGNALIAVCEKSR